ncbi:PREDICTED: protein transport protein SEC31 homolog B isoform X2 [Fragaria vesca subsp. vesca]|uniref:protein transport protein SEC31 homolog B isoform X2 n=1 Tax=Fragaria vesca subsp. vesca TaxID=101020 RepID=UPI0002C363DA|nr:PREDICTED: protein transport protein SEC31 homolog B isoform X2 [Fragaria vesca subsp. vesca]
MACIKGVNRSASVAVAPDAPYMAAGTMAGAVDLSFSSSANIEIFKLDLQSDDRDLPVVGESTSSERFNRLSWSKPAAGSGSQDFGLGLIAGGLVDGTIDIWNPLTLIRSKTGENASVEHLTRHKGPVRGLEFNAITPHLLASGADDGEICIWDLANPTEPTQFPPLKGSGSAAQGEISFLSWNSKVQHILASSSYNGTTVIWDLKKQKPVISFTDSVRRRCSVLQWNPDIATQLVVASDDDGSPSLRLWDMRNIMSPVKEFVGHTKGVIAMSWCPNDSSYLLTCAKDNRTICWDTVSAEIVCELPAGTHWNFDVHWYPKVPGVISASSFDGKIGIYNIEGCSRYGVGESDFGAGPLRAPKWYKRPAGASFGFGGKIVSFHPSSSGAGASEVYVHSLVTEQSLVDRSSEFESAIQNGERSSLRALCDKKAQESETADDRETWGLLRVMFEDDGTARTNLITHLGFIVPEETKEIVEDNLSAEVNAPGIEDSTTDKAGLGDEKETTIFPSDNGEDFFNNLPSPKADTPHSTSGDKFVVGDTVPITDQVQEEHDELEESADPSFDESVQHALAVGDYKGAVAKCMSANKMADALVIAHAGGPTLWESTRDQYLKLSHSPYLKIVSAMVSNDLSSLVNTRPLKFWKETLAVLCSFSSVEAWEDLCNMLAARLIAAGNTLAATICYICAGNIDKTVDIWSRNLTTDHEGRSYVDLLQELMEKTIVLALATGQKRFSASLCKLVEKYAEILASQGLLTTALEYLKLLGTDELPPELVILRDRIALSTEPEKVAKFENPAPANIYPEPNPYRPGNVSYYQEPTPTHVQPRGPGNTYDVYPEPANPPYHGYSPAPFHQPPSQPPSQPPNMFVPIQTPQVPKDKFYTTPAPTQPPATFIPSTPPALLNGEKYQQANTNSLGSQLYPGGAFQHMQTGPSSGAPHQSHVNPVPGNKMPQSVPPPQSGFMPVTNPGVVQGTLQPSSPPAPARQSVAPAPPPTIQTADTSKVPAHQKPIIATLGRLFNETSEALGGSRANPAKKREIEDNSKKIGALFAKLNSGDISKNAADNLVQLCQALDNGDFNTALTIQIHLTTTEWDECNFWLATLKRMIKTRQNVRLS